MKTLSFLTTATAIGVALAAEPASAIIIDFEETPMLPEGASTFASAGPAQNISVDGVTFSGGVVLGDPTFLPATPLATTPNLYSTANHPSGDAVGDPSLLSTLSIAIDPLLEATTVEGLLFNGLIDTDTFVIEAFSQGMLVDSVTLANLPSNENQGFDVFRLDSEDLAIDSVTIAADLSGPLPNEWDFFIDTVAIGEPIENIIEEPDHNAVPEPSTVLGFLAFGGLSLAMKRKKPDSQRVQQ